MSVDPHVLVEQVHLLDQTQRRVLGHLLQRRPVARDSNVSFEAGLTRGQRAADRLAAFGGSWTFIALFVLVGALWIGANLMTRSPVDPFPFILLNLVLSCVAALQAPVIMMSQNRLAAKDRLDAQHDYEVNLKAELEVAALHLKVDELRERQWPELLQVQRRQLELLEALAGDRPDRPR
jgi:uncharacterized membrane protein